MTFRTTAVITAIVTFILGAGFLLATRLMVARWQIDPTDSVLLFGRRIGAIYLGLAVMFFLARGAAATVERRALSAGAAVVCSMLAALGVYEFSAGHAGRGILVSVAVESLLTLAYIRLLVVWREHGPRA